MKDWWIVLLILLLVGLAFGGGWFARGKIPPEIITHIVKDTITPGPPIVVTKIKEVTVVDEAQKDRADKLAQRLLEYESANDSLAPYLLSWETWTDLQGITPQGISLTGSARILSDPVERKAFLNVYVDSILVPVEIREVVRYDASVPWYIPVGCAVGGVLVGAAAVKTLQ
jgi:hypothetical protein